MQRFPKLITVLLFFACSIGWQAQAVGGVIKIETKTTVKSTADRLEIIITAKNNGTSPAHNVQISLMVLGEELKASGVPVVKPGDSTTAEFEKHIKGIKQGRYPLTVRVDFYDANQYPFSAVSGMTFHYQEDAHTDLIVMGKDIKMEKEGVITYDIKNLGAESKNIMVNLVLPKELYVKESTAKLIVGARSEKAISFPINNFSALEGATYPIFSYFEFDADDTHYTKAVKSQVSIVKKKNLFRRFRRLWIILTVILASAFIVAMIKGYKRK